ncbi:MAG: SAV_6107 family HEPN domain-containing protein [Candidatus Nanopelagicales bacterium]
MTSSRPADELVASARRSLTEASIATTPAERYAAAHLAALRAAAAVLAARSRPTPRRARVRSVWTLLPQVAPELAEWSGFFAAGAGKRAAAEAGLACVSLREADDLVREADAFVARVAQALGLAHQPSMADALLHVG